MAVVVALWDTVPANDRSHPHEPPTLSHWVGRAAISPSSTHAKSPGRCPWVWPVATKIFMTVLLFTDSAQAGVAVEHRLDQIGRASGRERARSAGHDGDTKR